jgi:hypothetical protein
LGGGGGGSSTSGSEINRRDQLAHTGRERGRDRIKGKRLTEIFIVDIHSSGLDLGFGLFGSVGNGFSFSS